jgi:hypothetical protein
MARKACWLLLCAFGLVCSCHKEEDVPDAVAEAIAPRFVGQKGVSWKSDTRAADQTWTSGDEIGIYMLRTSENVSNASCKNRKYIAEGTDGKFEPAVANHAIYFQPGESVRFVAYYPYSTSADAANTLTFDFADQSEQAWKEAKDFAFHKGATNYSSSNPNVALAFQHKFCKIKITIKKGSGGPDLTTLTAVTLTNMPVSATVDLAALALDENSVTALGISTMPTDITSYVVSPTETQAVAEAIVPPHDGGSDREFHFLFDSNTTYKYSLPNNVAFESGKEYNYEFTLYNSTVSDGLTNCYIVKPGNSKTFPVSRAYVDDTEKLRVDPPDATYNGTIGASVLWTDPEDLKDLIEVKVTGSGNQAIVTVRTNDIPEGGGGNAVVGIYKNDNPTELVWSYHIWVTDPDDIETWENTSNKEQQFIFMDRNLGATAIDNSGLYYQWGRKDPFPGSNATSSNGWMGDNVEIDIIESIKIPTTFIKHDTNWLSGIKADLWNDSGKKTIYDPCPAGWRVPVFTEGETFNFENNAQFPITGHINGSDGIYDDEGERRWCWSASATESGGSCFLNIIENNGTVEPSTSPANGQSVRCVQES